MNKWRRRRHLNRMTREASELGFYDDDTSLEEILRVCKETRRELARELEGPEVPQVYPYPKDRPVNRRLISEIDKGQKPRRKL